MPDPLTMDIPHQLGRADARARIESGLGQIAKAIPGGALKSQQWDGDTLTFVVEAMGQRIGARLDILDTRVHAIIDLPGWAALFAGKVKSQLLGTGQKLLR
ncbi:MAG: polyhydroxyalkanoic acid system family protein [Novosphingobium sp.]